MDPFGKKDVTTTLEMEVAVPEQKHPLVPDMAVSGVVATDVEEMAIGAHNKADNAASMAGEAHDKVEAVAEVAADTAAKVGAQSEQIEAVAVELKKVKALVSADAPIPPKNPAMVADMTKANLDRALERIEDRRVSAERTIEDAEKVIAEEEALIAESVAVLKGLPAEAAPFLTKSRKYYQDFEEMLEASAAIDDDE